MSGSTDGKRAHDILLGFAPLSRHGACWYYVWQAYAQAGAWTNMGSSPTAYRGWELSNGKHWGDRNPPNGAAIWLGRRYDGNMDGDVFIAGSSDGQHAATDQPTYGKTGVTSIQDRINLCGREYLGWTDHVLDCPIIFEKAEVPDMTPEESNMLTQVYNAIFLGGPSMPDGARSLAQTVSDIANGGRPWVVRTDPPNPDIVVRDGTVSTTQEIADIKTMLLAVWDRLDGFSGPVRGHGNGNGHD